jgi:hypothetical protein
MIGTLLGKDEILKMKDEGNGSKDERWTTIHGIFRIWEGWGFFENREHGFPNEINEKLMNYCISS